MSRQRRQDEMADQTNSDDGLAPRANELYWDSDVGVNQIAEDLGISKGSLYDMVRPLPSGLPCPRCGEEMVFPNRTARERGFLSCPDCGLEEDEESVQAAWSETTGRAGGGAVVVPPEAVRRAREGSDREDLRRILAGTALLGVAAGIAIATFVRRD